MLKEDISFWNERKFQKIRLHMFIVKFVGQCLETYVARIINRLENLSSYPSYSTTANPAMIMTFRMAYFSFRLLIV
jgi:hypothetical protein